MTNNKLTAYTERGAAIGYLRISLGLIWLVNLWFHFHAAYFNHYTSQYTSAIANGPHWAAGYLTGIIDSVQAIGPHAVVIATLLLESLITVSLLTGWLGRLFAWLGLAYSLFMFATVTTFGAPFPVGYTDPGPWSPYIVMFVFVLEAQAWQYAPNIFSAKHPRPDNTDADPMKFTRWIFGLLWAFEAYWKWQPNFLFHFLDQLTPALQGQPAWIAAYIGLVIAGIKLIGPAIIGWLTAIVETLIAASLLTGKYMRYGLALGAFWSMGIWTTAEGWGGPYSHGFSGSPMPGDIFGNAINYALIFLAIAAATGVWSSDRRR